MLTNYDNITELTTEEVLLVNGGGKVAYYVGYAFGWLDAHMDAFMNSQAIYADYGPKC
jgi:hypothetical protein